ncbi:MAG: Gfo/Idh/MocA family oxidoreductase [Candidatus Brocadiia bacterium]
MATDSVRVGVVGCGGFGLFALQQFAQVPGVELTGMSGTHRDAAYRAAQRFGIPDIVEVEAMVQQPDVDLVYISTPPFLHHQQVMLALQAGKHVIVEKPLALTLQQADEMVETARRADRLLACDLMQRYNPLFDAVRGLVERRPLGEPLHAYFENYASDEALGPDHWFWDRSLSGGIFVEHGVHFFDLFEGWFGPGTVEAAQVGRRPGTDIEEQVQCAVRYSNGVLANFYHGFHQPNRMDRQQLRIVFERGDITLEGWIPTGVRIHAIADEADTRALCDLFPRATLDVTTNWSGKERLCRARQKELDVYQMIEMTQGADVEKMHRYGRLLRALVQDQLAYLRDRDHERRITEANGRRSLEVALEADRLAHAGESEGQ